MAAPGLPAKLLADLEKLRGRVQQAEKDALLVHSRAVQHRVDDAATEEVRKLCSDLNSAAGRFSALLGEEREVVQRTVECLRCGAEVAAGCLGAHVLEHHIPAGLVQLNPFDKEPEVVAKLARERERLAAAIERGDRATLLEGLTGILPAENQDDDFSRIAENVAGPQARSAPGEAQRVALEALCCFLRRDSVELEALKENALHPASHARLGSTTLGAALQAALPNATAKTRRGVYYLTLYGWLLVSRPRRDVLRAALQLQWFVQDGVRLGKLMGGLAVAKNGTEAAAGSDTPRILWQALLLRSTPSCSGWLRVPVGPRNVLSKNVFFMRSPRAFPHLRTSENSAR